MKAFPLTVCVCVCVCDFKERGSMLVCVRDTYQRCWATKLLPFSLLMGQTAVEQLCAQVWENVCVSGVKGMQCLYVCVCVCVCVCVRERKIEKQCCNLCCTSDPTALGCQRLCWGLLTWEKKKKRQHIRLHQRERERERGKRWEYETRVEREEAVWFKMFVFTCTFTTDWRQRESQGV